MAADAERYPQGVLTNNAENSSALTSSVEEATARCSGGPDACVPTPAQSLDREEGLWLLADLAVRVLGVRARACVRPVRHARAVIALTGRVCQVKPELQVGPTCGLVALRMAAVTLWERTRCAAPSAEATPVCSVQDLLAQAVARGFSLQGTSVHAHSHV